MAYFKDLTEYRYIEEPKPGVLNVGWLGKWHLFRTGVTSHAFQAALGDLCENHGSNFCGGHHVCEFCFGASWHDPYYRRMGNGEIRVRGADGIWYVAPRLIIHYVAAHHYFPPLAFLEAVENPSEIGKLERPQFTYESIRESDRRMRELRGPPITEAELDRIVEQGLRRDRGPKRP